MLREIMALTFFDWQEIIFVLCKHYFLCRFYFEQMAQHILMQYLQDDESHMLYE